MIVVLLASRTCCTSIAAGLLWCRAVCQRHEPVLYTSWVMMISVGDTFSKLFKWCRTYFQFPLSWLSPLWPHWDLLRVMIHLADQQLAPFSFAIFQSECASCVISEMDADDWAGIQHASGHGTMVLSLSPILVAFTWHAMILGGDLVLVWFLWTCYPR